MSVSRLQRFEQEFDTVDMAEFYQINKVDNKVDEKIKIQKTVHSDYILLTIHFRKSPPCPEFDLPYEINEMIREYLIYVIEIQIKIKYSPSYPFSPPIWFLLAVYHNLVTEVSLLDYYSYKVNQHNQSYVAYIVSLGSHPNYMDNGWTPAITIDKDILSFIQKINHFDEVLVCV